MTELILMGKVFDDKEIEVLKQQLQYYSHEEFLVCLKNLHSSNLDIAKAIKIVHLNFVSIKEKISGVLKEKIVHILSQDFYSEIIHLLFLIEKDSRYMRHIHESKLLYIIDDYRDTFLQLITTYSALRKDDTSNFAFSIDSKYF